MHNKYSLTRLKLSVVANRRARGFTMIELIAVIVIIGILAGVVILSYGNWQQNITTSQIKSDLSTAATAMENSRNFGNTYPSSIPSTFTSSDNETVSGGARNGGKDYCISITSTKYPSLSYHIVSTDSAKTPQSGPCPPVDPVSQTISYNGSYQTFTIPNGVSSVTMEVWGAQGGGSTGGLGGYAKGTISVTPGEVLRIYVGGQGATGTCAGNACMPGGYNGGGNGGGSDISSTGYGGGGATDIRRSPYGLVDRLIVGGGGGSKGGEHAGVGAGGAGGQTGVNGSVCSGGCSYTGYPGGAGAGATSSSGGAGGTGGYYSYPTYPGGVGGSGSTGQGGNGGSCWFSGGGAGGGGYYGGGGGGCPNQNGGGGGSSWVDPSATSVTYTTGTRSGDGQAILSYYP